METRRLRNLQHPSQIETLLETLVARADLLPRGSYRVRDLKALSAPLQTIAAQAGSEGRVWASWSDTRKIWLFTCEMPLQLSRERGTPVLLVNRYGENGELQDTGAWTADAEGKWQRSQQ